MHTYTHACWSHRLQMVVIYAASGATLLVGYDRLHTHINPSPLSHTLSYVIAITPFYYVTYIILHTLCVCVYVVFYRVNSPCR